jgi:hypothetical protein
MDFFDPETKIHYQGVAKPVIAQPFFSAQLVQDRSSFRRSDEFDDPDLRFRVGFDVPLRRPKVRVPG